MDAASFLWWIGLLCVVVLSGDEFLLVCTLCSIFVFFVFYDSSHIYFEFEDHPTTTTAAFILFCEFRFVLV